MMKRIQEPELMDGAEQAEAYAAADFAAPHSRVIELFREAFPGADISGDVLDLGCGPGDIAMRFARAFPNCRVIGLDGSIEMLKRGHKILHALPPAIRDRVVLVSGILPDVALYGQTFSTIISNSLLHHLHDPQVMWNSVRKFAKQGARIFAVDLMRPADEATAQALTEQYCAGEPEILQRDFYNSLLAAFTPEEIRRQLAAAEMPDFEVRAVSDRHVAIWGTLEMANAELRTPNADIEMTRTPAQMLMTNDKGQITRDKPRFRGVLFDLDGTLLDTLQDLGDSVNRVLAANNFPTHAMEAYRYFVGEGARTLIERALPETNRDAATIEAVLADYRRDYAVHWRDSTKPYNGIMDALVEMEKRGLALGVLSNKPHAMTLKCIEGFLPAVPFKAILGQRDDVAKKPDPAGAHEAARLMGVDLGEILYVGDTGVDMETARAAGMFALGVTWGFRPESELQENGADAIIHHPRQLLDHLD